METFDIHTFSDMVAQCKEGNFKEINHEEYPSDNAGFSVETLSSLTSQYTKRSYDNIIFKQISHTDDVIKKFKIEKDKPAIYLTGDISSANDIRRSSRQAVGIFDKLIDQTERIINFDVNKHNDKSSSKIILSQIIKIRSEYDDKTKKLISNNGKEPKPFHDLFEKYVEYTSKTAKDFIEIVVMGVWRGFSSDGIYNDLARIVNGTLKEFGIYTADIEIGDSVNFDICTIADDDGNEQTDDAEKIDRIKRIQRYPYMFSDDNIILTGKVNVWRKNK